MNQLRSKDENLVCSYLSLRRAVGIIGIGLPFTLAIGGLFRGIDLQESISFYYHTDMRNLFVGSMCAIAVFLWPGSNKPVFWFEACAIMFFGISRLIKGEAILKDRITQPAIRIVAPRIPM